MLFSNLIKENQKIWDAYLHHDFVKKLEDKSLKQENFLFISSKIIFICLITQNATQG